MECSVLKVDYRQIDRAIRLYLKTGDERAFVKQFIEGSIPSKMRFDRRTLDSSDEVLKSVKEFADTVELVIINLKGKFPGSVTALDNLLSNLDNLLFIPTDNNQKGTGSSEEQDEAEEDKSLTESFDRNRAKLDEHLKEFYGLGSYNIINNLKDLFEDAITSAAYWDRNSGDIIVNNNSILNRNILKYKNILYKRLVTFLKQEGILKNDALESMVDEEGKFIGREYFHTLEKFYSYFSNLENAQDLLVTDNKNRINNTLKKEKQERYTALVLTLLNIPDEKLRERIRTRIINAHGRRIGNDFENTPLYTADSYSEYFKTLNSMIKDKSFNLQDVKVNLGNGDTQTVSQILEFFNSEDSTLLNAANAYTILTHFDKLIKERQTSISIDKGLEDIEIADPNKYSYHLDTSHEKKGWQTSEDVSSEKYTSTLTKALFKLIKIYDYNTDQYTNKRVDSTSFIVSTRNFIDDIVYGRIGFSGDDVKDSFVQKSANELKECVVNLHSNPTKNFQRILELLFDNGNYDLIDRIKPIEGKKLLTTNDINIMYSIYNAVFNKNNMNSLIKAELSQASSINARALSLVGEIAGYVDRNASMHYMETSIDYENGNVIIKVKRKFSNNIGLKKTIDTINNLANHRTDQSMKSLRDKYKFTYPTSSLGGLIYSVKIGDNDFKISVADMGSKIFYGKGQAVTTETHTLLKTLDKVDLIDFRNHVISGTILSPEEQQLKELLDYFEDTLGIKFKTDPEFNLQILQIFKENYNPANIERGVKGNHSPSENYSGYLEPLLMLAMRANYVNERRAEAANAKKTLMDYITSLGSKDDGIYGNYSRNKNTNHVFSERWEDLQYQVVSRQDDVLSMWEDSKAMLTGVASRATTKDRGGNNIPNNGVNKLGNILHHEIAKQLNNPNSNVTSLLFVQQDGLIKGTLHDLEVTSQDGDYKSLRDFSSGELFYHSIFNKFWGNYIGQGSVIILPTTYSDKTTFLNWNISTKFMGGKDILSAEYDESYKYRSAIVGMYGDTIGKMYRDVWTSTKNKLQIIADAYNNNNDTRLSFKEVLNLLSEEQLISYASTLGLTLEKDKDYRKRSKNSCTYNELLEYYSDYLYAPNAKGQYANLESYLDQQKSIFVLNLLQANSSFQVIDYNDNINNYIKDKADYSNVRNSVINTIIEYFKKDKTNGVEKRKKFFNTWVDKNTGKLILAKTSNGMPILGIGEAYNGESVTLNPFLDKFFYIEGLLSNNLRMSLTGSEINHPDKAKKSTYNLAKKLDLKNAKNIDVLRKALGLNRLTVTEALNLQSFLKKNTITIHDLASQATLDKAKTAGIGTLVDRVYHRTLTDIANTAQGTQFKRNVIIPATLQYCRQKAIDGIPPKIKCAVIMDEKAPVYNYRGDKEESIDAADGSAQITPFQSIMENRSLDSLAVGFIKKPIWHAYDAESGTAFLAKFATDTITNESMRASLKANSSLFRMFKKMTNLLWQGDVDLTQGITIGRKSTPATMRTWFQTRILGNAVENNVLIGNNRLIYQDGYGDNIEILSLLADKTDLPVYYTEEIDILLKNTPNAKPQKVYHVFYNQGTNKSIHIKFDSAEKARAFIRSTPGAHTINSLYELHTALGGINCVDSQGNYSEFNNEVVVNYMTEIGSIREGHTSSEQKDQDSYYQPMKLYHIGYALNNSAVKNGAKNINKSSAWSDDSELNYFEVDSEGLGMQMNADHDIIDSELTEFSQVITATSAYGYTYDNSNEIFISLGMAAFQASDKALRAIEDFINISFDDDESKQLALSDLYDAVGRIIMTNRSIKDQESLQNVIMGAVLKIFYNSKNHLTDDAKIPFSDANVYADFIATLASTINKESIKRKHPGSGCVMVPGYNMIQYFEIDGQKLMTEDILKNARKDYKNDLIQTSIDHYNITMESLDLLFERYPELAKLGTKEDYLRYISTVFPQSLDKSIYWHGSNSDFSGGLDTAKKGEGSGAPETKKRNDLYLNKEAWTSLQYIDGVNRVGKDKNGFGHWNKLYWELKQIMSNGRRQSNDWKNIVINDETVREGIPNKMGVFNRDNGGENGKWLEEIKADYGYEGKTNKEFFEDIFGIQYGVDTFQTWIDRNAKIFKSMQGATTGIYPVLINVTNPIRETGEDTYYEEHRGLITRAIEEGRDTILSYKADNEFGSDVAIVLNVDKSRTYFLGSKLDLKGFEKFMKSQTKPTKALVGWDVKFNKITVQEGEELKSYYLGNMSIKNINKLFLELGIPVTSKYYSESLDNNAVMEGLIDQYLTKKQSKAPVYDDNTWFMPSDIVNIFDEYGQVLKTIDLDSLPKYYKFKQGLDTLELATGIKIDVDYESGIATVNGKEYAISDNLRNEIIVDLGITELPIYKYQVNVTKPHNLRPSLIRWQYKGEDGNVYYRNIFDTDVIRNSYINRSSLGENYRTKIQDILHKLYEGKDDLNKQIIEGSLENTAAELVMSNIYQDKFEIGGESLYDVLNQGEEYFRQKTGKQLRIPSNRLYDIAFLSDTGNSTLISLHHIKASEDENRSVYENDFNELELMTNEKDEIVLMKGNRELFEVGRWTSAKDVIYRNGKFYRGTVELNSKDYRLKDANDITSVQRKIMYVRRFNTIDTIERKGRSRIEKNVLYEIADIKFFIEAMKDLPLRQGQTPIMSATNQRASIIDKMFGNHKAIYINGNKDWRKRGDSSPLQPVMAALSRIIGTRKDNGDGTFQYIGGNKYVSDDIKNLTYTQLDYLQEDLEEYIKPEKGKEKEDAKYRAERRKQNFAKWMKAQETFLLQEAHRKWVSFQDSTNFIASRIPAQTLQSFMSMKLVAWTQNSKNMAYVSHFQTYLQGSDYDIDKAYIMGQSYNNSANYIGWSTLFDYTSYATLQASKQLPVPKGEQWAKAARHLKGDKEAYAKATQIWQDTSETDADVEEFLQLTNGNIKDLQLESDRVKAITLLARIIKKTEANNRGIKYNGTNIEGLNNLMQLINDHEFTPLHPSIAESAYKNVASANIYTVAHDIRNRDQAYTAISMGILLKAAADSPKGNQAGSLNMLNPLTKYIMQYQNLVGKNVIAIAANGEKVWFNAYYYWTKILQSGNEEDIQRLKFKQTFKRIAGRAKGTPYEKSISILPDMNFRDTRIRNALLSQFNVTEKDLEYVYVDQLISQLLSAATDNAKELILAKINSGTNFARMYVYAIMTGYDINDIVAFMTSPVAEFVDQMSAANIFTKDSASNNPNSAINLAEGFINSDLFLHGTVTNTGTDEMGLEVKENVSKQSLVAVSFNNLPQEIKEAVKVEAELTESKIPFNQKTLNIAMKGLINVAIKLDKFNLKEALRIRNNDMEINTYLAYCQNIIDKLRGVYKQYLEGFDAAKADIVEFKKLYELATEVSTISTAYLSLNQGLPTDELGILKKIAAMEKIVTNRERIIGIRRNNMYANAKATIIEEDGEVQETKKRKERSPEKLYEEKRKVAMKIIENNPTLGNDETSIAEIITKLDNAYADDIMNNFDAVKYLLDNNYRQKVKDYYGLIMGTLNVFDMMEKIPTYQTNLECLKLLVVSNNLSVKSRLVNTLLRSNNNVSDQELRNVIRYADQLLTYKFAKEELFNQGKGIITLPNEIIGFDEYFKDTTVTLIDLGSLNGLATFRRWIENEFYDWVREHPVYGKNGAIKHLQRIQDGDQTILAMDIDLLEPNTNSLSELAYDEILRGMVELDDTKSAYNSQYTIADLLQLYNIIVNNNQYGSERLTTAFKVCTNPNNVLNTYLRYISETDLNPQDIYNDISLDYDNIDYKMTSAPLISKYAERNHKELYIKVKDDLRGYILKKYDSKNNKYNEDPLTKAILPTMKLLYNFSVYSPFLFLNSHDRDRKDNIMVFENILDKSLPELSAKELFKLKQDLYNLLQLSSISNRLRIFKNCY